MIINVNEYTDESFIKQLKKAFPLAVFEYSISSIQFESNDSLLAILAEINPELKAVDAYHSLKKSVLRLNDKMLILYEMQNDYCNIEFKFSSLKITIIVNRSECLVKIDENKTLNISLNFLEKSIDKMTTSGCYQRIAPHHNFYKLVVLLFFLKEIKPYLYEDGYDRESFVTDFLNDPERYENYVYLQEMIVI